MDFDGAISAHVDWKMKLRGYISKPDKSIDANVVQKDNQCALGKWIYGEGAKHNTMPEYSQLRDEHAKFHKCAAEVIRTVDSGNPDKAKTMIEAGSEYMKISNQCVGLIRQMKQKVGG